MVRLARVRDKDDRLRSYSHTALRTAFWSFNPKTNELDARRLLRVVIRYVFYYERDYGFGGHANDLESAEIYIEPTKTGEALRITRVAASAHGIGWYTNELRIDEEDDLVVPIHLFVEEGKHATAPDRNAA